MLRNYFFSKIAYFNCVILKGLKAQHLTGIELVSNISDAKLYGNKISSSEISFYPNQLRSGRFTADTKTAGSVCLLLQIAVPCLVFAKDECKLYLRGGTNAEHAPQIDYFTMVFMPIVKKFGVNLECEISRRGYYPKGK
jgi:RNA 3'-terminal phosphate cyclase (ATP)